MTLFEWLKASGGLPVQGLAALAPKPKPKDGAALCDADGYALYDSSDAQIIVRG